MKTILALIAVVCVLTLAVFVGNGGRTPSGPNTRTPAMSAPRVVCDASAQMQAQRKALFESLQRKQIIQKVDRPGTSYRVYVLPRFFSLTYDLKVNFMSVVYAWVYECKSGKPLRIFDALTNKSLGNFDEYGLDL